MLAGMGGSSTAAAHAGELLETAARLPGARPGPPPGARPVARGQDRRAAARQPEVGAPA